MQCGITSQKLILLRSASEAKNAAGSVGLLLLLDLFLISVALDHYPCLFNRTKSCVWQLLVYLSVSASVSAEGVVKLSASVSVESQFMKPEIDFRSVSSCQVALSKYRTLAAPVSHKILSYFHMHCLLLLPFLYRTESQNTGQSS